MPWKVASDIAERMKELREAAGWTQVDLAAVTGRRVAPISNWERAVSTPPRGVLERLAKGFGWPVEMFAERGPRPSSIIRGPVALPSMTTAPADLGELPSLEGKSLAEVYRLALDDVMGWTAKRADLRPAATRANQLIAAVREAALREAASLAVDRDAVERALQLELRVAQDRLRALQTPRKRPRTG